MVPLKNFSLHSGIRNGTLNYTYLANGSGCNLQSTSICIFRFVRLLIIFCENIHVSKYFKNSDYPNLVLMNRNFDSILQLLQSKFYRVVQLSQLAQCYRFQCFFFILCGIKIFITLHVVIVITTIHALADVCGDRAMDCLLGHLK